MKTGKSPVISVRKHPLQARSKGLVTDILEAATRVLVSDGVLHFTTARVAEKAGISVGSLYQYFPNKEAILFRLQADEWQVTLALLGRILADSSRSPFDRLKEAVRAFFESERQECALRMALADAAPLYRDTPEAKDIRQSSVSCMLGFMNEALPQATAGERRFAADVLMTCMEAVGEKLSEQVRSKSEVDAIAVAVSEMFCLYLSYGVSHT